MININTLTEEKGIELYLDFWNNFLTIERFSHYYEITEKQAEELLQKYKKIFNEKADKRELKNTIEQIKELFSTLDIMEQLELLKDLQEDNEIE